MKFDRAHDIQVKVNRILFVLSLPHIDRTRVVCMRSWGSKSNAIARIWSMPKIWQQALGIKSHYVIEVISERFDSLDEEDQERTLIHELCLPSSEMIVIEDEEGLKIVKIKDLVEEEFKIAKKIIKEQNLEWVIPSKDYKVISCNIKNRNIEMRRIEKLIRRENYENCLIEIVTRDGRKISTSPKHPIFYTRHGYSYDHPKGYIKIRKCKAEDVISLGKHVRLIELFKIPKLGKEINEINLKKMIEKNEMKNYIFDKNFIKKKGVKGIKIPEKLILDNSLGKFFGFYLSEGSIDNKSGAVSFSFNKNEIEYHHFTKKILKERFNAIPKEREIKHNCKIIYTNSRLLQKIIWDILGFGKGAYEKKIPPFVYYAPNEFISGLLDGWFAGDGTTTYSKRYKTLTLSSFSKSIELIFGMSLLLARLGIVTRFRRNQNDILIQSYFVPKFFKIAKSKIKSKNLEKFVNEIQRMKNENNFRFLKYPKIRKVTKLPYREKYFYNLEVKKNNNFMHASGIFTHNCHIPKTFSGALVPHKCFGKIIDDRAVEKIYKEYKKKMKEFE